MIEIIYIKSENNGRVAVNFKKGRKWNTENSKI